MTPSSGSPHGYDPRVLRFIARKQVLALSLDAAGFQAAVAQIGGVASDDVGFRVVQRTMDEAEGWPAGHWVKRVIPGDVQAAVFTADIEGATKWLLGRTSGNFAQMHPDFVGLEAIEDSDGKRFAEFEFGQLSGAWVNGRTGEVTQVPGGTPVELRPPADVGPPIS